MAQRSDAWRDYRRRRAVLSFALLAAAVCVAVLTLLDVEGGIVLAFCLFVPWCIFFVAIWYTSFPCPACQNEWFGERVPADESADLRTILSSGHSSNLLHALLRLCAQKLCCHCGLPKFMDPSGWNP